jgi:ribosomal protein S18 acetylase RimI-like enzyme
MLTSPLAWRVEQTELNAWPALQEIFFGSWVLRFGGGLSRRVNSVNALVPDAVGGDAVIAACEAHYRRRGLPPIFRVPSFLDPALDARAAARGYRAEGLSLTLYGDIAGMAPLADAEVRLLAMPAAEWCAAMARLQGYSADQARIYARIVGRIAVPARFAALEVDGAPAALAYGAVHDGILCYESVVTDPAQRRRGHARRVLRALAAWAAAAGATAACLQVEAGNAPALPLYHSLGLGTELYRYHYRRAPN